MEFATCGVTSVLKIFWTLGNFKISDFWILPDCAWKLTFHTGSYSQAVEENMKFLCLCFRESCLLEISGKSLLSKYQSVSEVKKKSEEKTLFSSSLRVYEISMEAETQHHQE